MEIISKFYLSVSIILQTLQQLKDVYGDSVDKVIQGNTSNIVFLKSTDDAMIDTLVKLSGQTHESLIESKTITKDNERLLNKNEGRISYTMSTKERPVIAFNDMLFIPPRNSMVFRAGSSPIWNRNETALAMSWRLLQNTIKNPRKEYTLQTVPTLSTAMDYDIRKNQPNFYAMLDKRLEQAKTVDTIRQQYMDAYGYKEYQMEQLDPDVLSDDLMIAINEMLYGTGIDKTGEDAYWHEAGFSSYDEFIEAQMEADEQGGEELLKSSKANTELQSEVDKLKTQVDKDSLLIFANGNISKSFLVSPAGQIIGQMDRLLSEAYIETKSYFKNDSKFRYDEKSGELRSDKNELFVRSLTGANAEDFKKLEADTVDPNSSIYSDDEFDEAVTLTHEVTPEFIKWLADRSTWSDIAGGRFDREAGRLYSLKYDFNGYDESNESN